MGTMRYKPSDKVRIKSLDWYNENKNEMNPTIACYCDQETVIEDIITITIKDKGQRYVVKLGNHGKMYITDEMIEGLAEEETPKFKIHDKVKTVDGFTGVILNVGYDNNIHCFRYYVSCILNREWYSESQLKLYDSKENEFTLPEGYQFKDKNGNVINATKIVLEKKKKEYPKTYGECCEIVKVGKEHTLKGTTVRINYKIALFESLQELIICRDAYWKIAGEEMGLGKPWEPDWCDDSQDKYCIYQDYKEFKFELVLSSNVILAFPTEEMRDAFYENFKELINEVKELL